MITTETNRNVTVWPLADLFEALHKEGFQLRPDDHLEIVQVLDTFQPQTHTELQALMAPLIVISEDEQEKFDRIFERVWQQGGLNPHIATPKPAKPIRWVWFIIGLLSLLALGYVAFLWPGPAFRPDIQVISGASGPSQVGDTLVFRVDSSLRRAAGPMARWQWETPEGKPYPKPTEPELTVVAQRSGPLVVNLRSQRGRGLLFTTWTDSLRSVEHSICDKLPVIQLDSTSRKNLSGSISYRFAAKIVPSSSGIQQTQWRFDGAVVAQNQPVWERTFPVGVNPSFHDIRFEAIPDTLQRLCFGEAKLTIGIPGTDNPSFTFDVEQAGNAIGPQTERDQKYVWALWALGLLLAGLITYYSWRILRDRQRKEAEAPLPPTNELPPTVDDQAPPDSLAQFKSNKPPLEIPLENREAELITRDQPFYQLVRTLRQPTEGDTQRLNLSQTMHATIREGGLPTLIFQPHLVETEYLFLIDRSQARSQQVALFNYLFRTFVQENVCVERFFFHKTFNNFTNEKHPKGLSLRQLSDTYRQNTLIIWSDGYPLLYPLYPVVEPGIRDTLIDWALRAILTPVPFADWGAKEGALQADFLVLPADLIGQLRLIQALNEKQTDQNTYLGRQTDKLYSTEYIDFEEVDELQTYLGDDLLQWVAALAIYPRIRWEIVVEMGRDLLPLERVNFTNLLKLARIDWMHEGSFPDYTRLELLKVLRPENEAIARQTLLRMLAYAEQYFPGEHFYDGEKYLLQTVNQFALYAYNPIRFAEYEPAQQVFKTLYEKELFPDGATLHYLKNPTGQWTTLLPSDTLSIPRKEVREGPDQPKGTSLEAYLDSKPVAPEAEPKKPAEPVVEPVKQEWKRYVLPGLIVVAGLLLAWVWNVSSKPENQVLNRSQQLTITVVIEPNECANPMNTGVTQNPHWTVSVNDSLYSLSNLNLNGTRLYSLTNLSSSTSTDFDNRTSTRLRVTVSVKDTTGEEQSTSVPLTHDTLRVRINCPLSSTVVLGKTDTSESDYSQRGFGFTRGPLSLSMFIPLLQDTLTRRGIPSRVAKQLATPLVKRISPDVWDIIEIFFWITEDLNRDNKPDFLFSLLNGPFDGNGRGITTVVLLSGEKNQYVGYATEPVWGRDETEALPSLDQIRLLPKTQQPYFLQHERDFPFLPLKLSGMSKAIVK